jgi:hypothetical protein
VRLTGARRETDERRGENVALTGIILLTDTGARCLTSVSPYHARVRFSSFEFSIRFPRYVITARIFIILQKQEAGALITPVPLLLVIVPCTCFRVGLAC